MRSNDETLMFQSIEEFIMAWNNGDPRSAASFFTDDAVRVGAFGDIQQGRKEIEVAFDKLLNETLKGAVITQDRGTIRMLTPELAVWRGGIEIIPDGSASPLKGHSVQVMKKINGKWMILETHPKLFPSPKQE